MALRTSRARAPGRVATPRVAKPTMHRKGALPAELALKAEALTELHCLIQRQLLLALSRMPDRNGRARDAVWCVLEALHAAFQGDRLTHKDLTAVAGGVISGSTVTRAILDAEERGLLSRRAHTRDGRSSLLEPTDRAREAVLTQADRGFDEVAEVVERYRRRLAALGAKAADAPAPAAGRRE